MDVQRNAAKRGGSNAAPVAASTDTTTGENILFRALRSAPRAPDTERNTTDARRLLFPFGTECRPSASPRVIHRENVRTSLGWVSPLDRALLDRASTSVVARMTKEDVYRALGNIREIARENI